MLRLSLLILSTVFAIATQAASVDVKDVDSSEDTTIEIHKGKKKSEDLPFEKTMTDERLPSKYEADTADINGDSAPLASEARTKWKDACNVWKKEVKTEHKYTAGLNCGTPTCSGDVGNKSCTSKATYKYKDE